MAHPQNVQRSASSGPGEARAAELDAAFGLGASVSRPSEWAAAIVQRYADAGECLGLDPAGVPTPWRGVLAWAGFPFAQGGALRWGRDLVEAPQAESIDEIAGILHLPPPAVLCDLSSLMLKPLRRYIQGRLGFRLQAAAGLRVWLWRQGAVIVSLLDVPAGGFGYGPEPGHRAGLAIAPGAWQELRW